MLYNMNVVHIYYIHIQHVICTYTTYVMVIYDMNMFFLLCTLRHTKKCGEVPCGEALASADELAETGTEE